MYWYTGLLDYNLAMIKLFLALLHGWNRYA
jgi:hypothetical protein